MTANANRSSTAVLLINLGTPDAPEEDAIRRYLKQFLSDPRVVNLPRWLWLPILNLIILRNRPAGLVEKYALIWGTKDGPIRNITNALARRVGSLMPDRQVVAAMTYGEPSVEKAFRELEGADEVVVIPMFPQYAGATTGAVIDALEAASQSVKPTFNLRLVEEYHTHQAYISSIAASIRRAKTFRDATPLVVFSFHGIPQAQAAAGDPYPQQCEATAALVAAELDLPADRWRLTYQSRFGPAPWLTPYTDKTMEALPGDGITDVLVVCPGFSADCLETIEEIRVLNKEIFMEAGGQRFNYVKALNASWDHAAMAVSLTNDHLE